MIQPIRETRELKKAVYPDYTETFLRAQVRKGLTTEKNHPHDFKAQAIIRDERKRMRERALVELELQTLITK